MNPDDKAKYLELRSEPPSTPSGLVEQEERAELNGFVFIARLLSAEAVRLQTAAGPGDDAFIKLGATRRRKFLLLSSSETETL